jgi:carbamoylphosphate synthase large subunit
MDLAARLGLRAPATRRVGSLPEVTDAIAEWGYPVVLKAENSFGGSGVTVVEGEAGIEAAFVRAAARAPSYTDRWQELAGAGLTAQSYVAGVPAMRTVSAWRGRVLAGASFAAERVHPSPLGQSTVLRPIDHDEMTTTVERLVDAIGCSGFVSFDFVLDDSGRAHLIEMNPRAIPATYLGRMAGGDVCGALAAHLAGAPAPEPTPLPARPRRIALFPQELERDPTLASLDDETVLHDVPFDDREVLRRYARRLARIHPGRRRFFEGYLALSEGPRSPGRVTGP